MNNDKKNGNANDVFAKQIAALKLQEEEEELAKKLGLYTNGLDLVDIFDDDEEFEDLNLDLEDLIDDYPESLNENKDDEEVKFYDQDIDVEMSAFLNNDQYKIDKNKRLAMANSCCEVLRKNEARSEDMIEYCEKLLFLDDNNQFGEFIEKYKNAYAQKNLQGEYFGYLGLKVKKALYEKEQAEKIGSPTEFSAELVIGAIAFVVAVAALVVPLAVLESVVESILKVVYTILGLVFLFTTGPGVIILLPLCMAVVQFVLGIVDVFMNPVLAMKLLFVAIFGLIAYGVLSHEYDWRNRSKTHSNNAKEMKSQYLPIAEKLFAQAKKTNLPPQILKYYENMLNDLNSIK